MLATLRVLLGKVCLRSLVGFALPAACAAEDEDTEDLGAQLTPAGYFDIFITVPSV